MYRGSNWPSEKVKQDREFQDRKSLGKCEECNIDRASTNCVSNLCRGCCLKINNNPLEENSEYIFCPRHKLRRPLPAAAVKFSTSLKLLPPWLAYPSYSRYELGWRMGGGQDYWSDFWGKYLELSPSERKWYRQDFPEPETCDGDWVGTYDYFESEDSDEIQP